MAVNFPAFCSSCGLIFGSGFVLDQATDITFINSGSTCPRCGAPANIPDGTFNVVDDTIEILSASDLTRARLLGLNAILEQAREGAIPEEQAVEAIVKEAPSLAPLIERFRPKMGKAFIKFLGVVIAILLAQGLAELRDDSATRKDVQEAVEQAVHECQQQQP